METVLRNLVYNAVRYARKEILVRFAVQPDGAYRLTVDDDGPGIPEAAREEAFRPFASFSAGGTGLGLAIVKRIVDAHRGHVVIRSIVGEGTTVVVTLPSVPAGLEDTRPDACG